MRKALCYLPLILAVCSFPGLNQIHARSDELPHIVDSATTILGEIEIVRVADFRQEVRLNRRVILRVDSERFGKLTGAQMYAINPIMPTSIIEVVHQRMPPFDEVVIFNNGHGAHYCGPGVVFLGLTKDGSYKFSSPTSWCAGEPKIVVGKNYIEVTARADVHSGRCSFAQISGGRWIYKEGKLFTKRFILLPDPVKNRRPC